MSDLIELDKTYNESLGGTVPQKFTVSYCKNLSCKYLKKDICMGYCCPYFKKHVIEGKKKSCSAYNKFKKQYDIEARNFIHKYYVLNSRVVVMNDVVYIHPNILSPEIVKLEDDKVKISTTYQENNTQRTIASINLEDFTYNRFIKVRNSLYDNFNILYYYFPLYTDKSGIVLTNQRVYFKDLVKGLTSLSTSIGFYFIKKDRKISSYDETSFEMIFEEDNTSLTEEIKVSLKVKVKEGFTATIDNQDEIKRQILEKGIETFKANSIVNIERDLK